MARQGGLLLVLVLSAMLLCVWSRRIFPFASGEVAPAFSWAPRPDEVVVALGEGFVRRGVRHFSDGTTPQGVIDLTNQPCPAGEKVPGDWERPLRQGEQLRLRRSGEGSPWQLERSFLPASQRILLGIPLHPATMSGNDWEALPGIGPKLAAAIENDRQKNGDFVSIEDLLRVKGVGKGKLAGWRCYFEPVGVKSKTD